METGWREENERSGTAIMVSLDQDDKARGVVFKNPLFLKAGIADIETSAVQDAPVSRNRKWLDSNARCISIVMGVLSLCLFIILPVLVMISPRVPSIGAPKVKSFSLVFYSGIFQSLLTRSIVSRQTRKRLERHHTLWKLFLFLTTCSIAFRPEATPALPKPPERSVERTINHGNCSMLEKIPENVVQFANSKQKERSHMLYDTSCDFGMPLVFKYDSATLGAMEILYNAMKSTTFADEMASNEGCTKIVLKMMTFLVFNPCQDDCTRAQFICDEQCVKIAASSETVKSQTMQRELVRKTNELTEALASVKLLQKEKMDEKKRFQSDLRAAKERHELQEEAMVEKHQGELNAKTATVEEKEKMCKLLSETVEKLEKRLDDERSDEREWFAREREWNAKEKKLTERLREAESKNNLQQQLAASEAQTANNGHDQEKLKAAQQEVTVLQEHVELLSEHLQMTKEFLATKTQEVSECEYHWASAKAKLAQCESEKMDHETYVVHVLEPIIVSLRDKMQRKDLNDVRKMLDAIQEKRLMEL